VPAITCRPVEVDVWLSPVEDGGAAHRFRAQLPYQIDVPAGGLPAGVRDHDEDPADPGHDDVGVVVGVGGGEAVAGTTSRFRATSAPHQRRASATPAPRGRWICAIVIGPDGSSKETSAESDSSRFC